MRRGFDQVPIVCRGNEERPEIEISARSILIELLFSLKFTQFDISAQLATEV